METYQTRLIDLFCTPPFMLHHKWGIMFLTINIFCLAFNCPLYRLHNIPNIRIPHIRPSRQAHPHLKQSLANPINISRSPAINRLPMHRLPNRTSLNARSIQEYSQRLHIIIRLAIRSSTRRSVNNASSTAHSPSHNSLVSILLPLNTYRRIQSNRAKPVVAVILATPQSSVHGRYPHKCYSSCSYTQSSHADSKDSSPDTE